VDNPPCIAGLQICLEEEAQDGVALADGFRIISELRKTRYMYDQTVSAAVRVSQWLIDHRS
jgi:hypothetical protein